MEIIFSAFLKKEWGFDGFTISDFNYGVLDTVEAANGGQDIEMLMTHYYGKHLIKAVEDGFVSEDVVDEAVIESLCEFERPTGGFQRLFPLKENIKYYSQFIADPQEENLALWKEMMKSN